MDALLRPVEFHILLSLAEEDRHGYAIRSATAARTDGEVMLEPGTIYRALHRLLELGFVAESAPRTGQDELVAAAQKTRVLGRT